MPQIRSITAFSNLDATDYAPQMTRAGAFLASAREAYTAAGQVVQTVRLATAPFPGHFAAISPAALPAFATQLYNAAQAQGIDFLALGPVRPADDPAYLTALEDVFRAAPGVFAGGVIAAPATGLDLAMAARVARLVDALGRVTPDGMTNLFFAALANCPAFSPFFPAAYHDGGEPAFALAIEAADLAVTAFADSTTAGEAQARLTEGITATAAQLLPTAEKLAAEHGLRFVGLDFSLAPYPTDARSLGGALEALGPSIGGYGLVAAASLMMNAVESANFPAVGFSGLMLPVLEDSILGARAAQGRLSVTDLLLLSAVCGTGLDCIPLAGDVGPDALYSMLLDVGALALRLDKPLTARLMPFPGKQAGDPLEFDFEYFASSRALASPAQGIRPGTVLSTGGGAVRIRPRR
ncbi:MAG: DUF711 family protein [Anaerolineales bacterium]